MIRHLGIFASALLLVGVLTPSLNGSYSIIHPLSTAQVLAYSNIETDGTCDEGEQVQVELWHVGNKVSSRNPFVGPISETWSQPFSAPPLGWIEGTGWRCELRDSDLELECTVNYTVVGFGA